MSETVSASATEDDLPMYHESAFVGYIGEYEARKLIRAGQANVERRAKKGSTLFERRIILKPGSAAARCKVAGALLAGSAGPALSTVYREEVWFRKNHDQERIVTGSVLTAKKYRRGIGFIPWREDDGFYPRRFNPDKILSSVFRSAAEMAASAAHKPARGLA